MILQQQHIGYMFYSTFVFIANKLESNRLINTMLMKCFRLLTEKFFISNIYIYMGSNWTGATSVNVLMGQIHGYHGGHADKQSSRSRFFTVWADLSFSAGLKFKKLFIKTVNIAFPAEDCNRHFVYRWR